MPLDGSVYQIYRVASQREMIETFDIWQKYKREKSFGEGIGNSAASEKEPRNTRVFPNERARVPRRLSQRPCCR